MTEHSAGVPNTTLPSRTNAPNGTSSREENQTTWHFARWAISRVTGSSQLSTTKSFAPLFSKMRSLRAM